MTKKINLSLQSATKIYEVPLGIRGKIRVNTSKYYANKIGLPSCVEQFARSLKIFLMREVERLDLQLTDMISRSRQKVRPGFYSNDFQYSSCVFSIKLCACVYIMYICIYT